MMKHIKCLFLVFLLLSIAGCSNSKEKHMTIPKGNPVETKPPNTDYKPAFPGQTRIEGVTTSTPLQVDVIASSIGNPWGITHLPDGKLLITDKAGFMQIFSMDGALLTKVTGFPAVVNQGQGGMLDVTIDPDFSSNRLIYWTFSEPYQSGNLTAVGKGRLSNSETTIENPIVIFRATPAYNGTLHFGGRLEFDPQGFLFVSTGERSDLITRPQAQELNSALGKILKITKDGAPAPGNPFASQPNAMPEIYTYGHRNVQGLSFHPETNELWSSEFGPKGGDELNLIQAGKNYGWPIITYGLEYSGAKIGEGITQKEGMEQPVYYWDPVISASGITFYNGEIAEWKNNLFLACLSGQHIDRLVIEGHKVVGEERLLEDQRERFRDVHQGKDGKLYAITDSGKLYRIGKKG